MNNISNLSWNFRGINNSISRRNLRSLVSNTRPMLIFLQETKCVVWDSILKESVWDCQGHGWLISPSIGQSGGLLTSWDASTLSLVDSLINRYWIWGRWELLNYNDIYCNCFNIYGPQEIDGKNQVWDQLSALLAKFAREPSSIVGDFNRVLSDEERLNCVYRRSDSMKFLSFLNNNDLGDISPSNFKYSWFVPAGKCSKIDRALVNNEWFKLAGWKLEGKSRKSSDHVPLLLSAGLQNWGQKPFRVCNVWLEDFGWKMLDS